MKYLRKNCHHPERDRYRQAAPLTLRTSALLFTSLYADTRIAQIRADYADVVCGRVFHQTLQDTIDSVHLPPLRFSTLWTDPILLQKLAALIVALEWGHTVCVAIDGVDRAGKTSLARELVAPLEAQGA